MKCSKAGKVRGCHAGAALRTKSNIARCDGGQYGTARGKYIDARTVVRKAGASVSLGGGSNDANFIGASQGILVCVIVFVTGGDGNKDSTVPEVLGGGVCGRIFSTSDAEIGNAPPSGGEDVCGAVIRCPIHPLSCP